MNKDAFNHMSDNELLAQFYAQRDNKLLGALLQRYTMLLLGVCMKYLKNEEAAKDAVQQVFLKVIAELQKYKVDYFKSWLYMVARNHCLMQLRDKTGKMTREINESFQPAAEESGLESLREKDRLLGLIEQSMNELSAEQKTCVTLFYLQKKSYSDIVASTGFNIMQVKSYIQNAKRNLKIMVEKKMRH
ncbi:MAG TPA: sigma-70 family RNA polymerase sigma factor [Panacibacter sp.]|nr:sigma-70 family RNA polymerase sigma factor [Panacibacter sp.]HNP45157.1 sigma-70 family RNA polymerase sigma factor [Panacibacter sp.]